MDTMKANDDKSPRCTELSIALCMARTESRAAVSCAMSVMHMAWRIGEWREDDALRRMMLSVIMLNVDAGIEFSMLDEEVELLCRMIHELEGGAK
jgi:hypothetical protein